MEECPRSSGNHREIQDLKGMLDAPAHERLNLAADEKLSHRTRVGLGLNRDGEKLVVRKRRMLLLAG